MPGTESSGAAKLMFLRTGQRGANALERGGPDRRAPEWSPECKAQERRSAAGERSISGEHGTAGVRTILGRRNIAGVRSGDGGHTGALERRVADRTESTGIEPSESTGIDGNRTVGIDGNRRSDGWPTGRRLWTHWGA